MGILNQGDRNTRLDLANLAEVQSSWIWHLLHFLKSPGNGHKVTLSKTEIILSYGKKHVT